ncbi:PP2C family protein-serine/threonine phosphatase [Nocardioides sp. MH1]|uniref:PP2C family protein-serine/threonine phosphatase n=1 Tax=Nocardioides sp. MH1 TaxID=3242490 RepID=UPI003521E0BF
MQDTIDNVRTTMRSDTATLLLLDESGTVLEPAASAGLGGRWRGAPHIRVGTGFAGSVAARDEPVVIQDVNEASVINPILRGFGVHRLLGVPVHGTEGLLGVLHVGTFAYRDFSETEVERLQRIADDIGVRLSDRRQDDAHLAALMLQRSLLPAAPPEIPGLDVAVRYLPAEGDLGGDWYDVFPLPDGKVGFVMGDVEGHGLWSAIVMGRLRSALRAYALDHDDPAEVLHRLDRKLCYFETDISATVLYAVTAPPYDTITICNAGHPAPLVARAGEEIAQTAELSAGLMLGVSPDAVRTSDVVRLTPGSSVAIFTDGLVERRGGDASQDPYGERLEVVRRAFRPEHDAEAACSHIVAAGLGDDAAEDDVALVVIRRVPG